jgi:hypothetical protein
VIKRKTKRNSGTNRLELENARILCSWRRSGGGEESL